jgi:NTP pyrophosphatase (non-canonical NTP hydrolase)
MSVNIEKLRELVILTQQWAESKGLIDKENIRAQYNYIHLELTELYKAIREGKDQDEIKDGFGDTMVTLIVFAHIRGVPPLIGLWLKCHHHKARTTEPSSILVDLQDFRYELYSHLHPGEAFTRLCAIARSNGYDIVECLEIAYNEISKRTGKMIDGDFVKDK